MYQKVPFTAPSNTLRDRISELLIQKSEHLKVYVYPLLVHNNIPVIRTPHSSSGTLHTCWDSYFSHFIFIRIPKCNLTVSYFIRRYTF